MQSVPNSFRRYKDIKTDNQSDRRKSSNLVRRPLNISFSAQTNANYEIADHCVTLKKSGTLSQVESLRSMSSSDQLSTTTEQALRNLPRSPSEEIFDRVSAGENVHDAHTTYYLY